MEDRKYNSDYINTTALNYIINVSFKLLKSSQTFKLIKKQFKIFEFVK